MRRYYEAGDLKAACAIARDAAPYVHPRLAAVALEGLLQDPELRVVEHRHAVRLVRKAVEAEPLQRQEGDADEARLDHHLDVLHPAQRRQQVLHLLPGLRVHDGRVFCRC